jgi:hypothetical protein
MAVGLPAWCGGSRGGLCVRRIVWRILWRVAWRVGRAGRPLLLVGRAGRPLLLVGRCWSAAAAAVGRCWSAAAAAVVTCPAGIIRTATYDVDVPFMQLGRHGWDIHAV